MHICIVHVRKCSTAYEAHLCAATIFDYFSIMTNRKTHVVGRLLLMIRLLLQSRANNLSLRVRHVGIHHRSDGFRIPQGVNKALPTLGVADEAEKEGVAIGVAAAGDGA